MNRFALVLLLPLLTGCDVHSKNPADGDGNVLITADESGQVEFNLPMAEGKVKLPSGIMSDGKVDIDGVKMMPGSSVSGFSVFAGDEGSTVTMAFKAPAPPDQVRSYFVNEFRRQGGEAALTGDTVQGKTRDGSAFKIDVAAAANGSQGKIEIHDKD